MNILAKYSLHFTSVFSLVMLGLAFNASANALLYTPSQEIKEIPSNTHDLSTDNRLLNRVIAHGETINTAKTMVLAQATAPRVELGQANLEITPQPSAKPARVTNISLEELEESDAQLVLSMDGPVTHEISVLAEPDRIVINLNRATSESVINQQSLNNDLIKLIRSEMLDESRLRFVLNLSGPAYANSLLQGPDNAGHYQLLIGVHKIPLPERNRISDRTQPAADGATRYNSSLIQLGLDYPNAPLGSIEAIEYDAGYMLPLSQLFQLLGFPITVHADTQLAEGWFIRQNQNFVLDVSKREVIVSGRQYSIPSKLVKIREREIFVDSTLLAQFFPVLFKIDPALLVLTIKPDPGLSAAERTQLVSRWLTLDGVEAVPLVPAPVEVTPIPKPKTKELPPDITPDMTLAELSDEDLIVLQPIIDDETYDDFFEVYQFGERYLVPLQALSELLHFSINVHPDNGKADGWYLSEDRTFSLDTIEQMIRLKDEKKPLPDQQVYVTETDIFVDSALLSQWFPLNIEIDLQQLSLNIVPEELLPFQIREKRLKKWARMQQARQAEKSYTLITTPYSLVSTPFIDLNLNQTLSNHGDNKSSTSYSVLAAGDLGYMSSNLFASGATNGNAVGTLRVSAGRQSDSAILLGPLKATQFLIGDVNSISVPLVAQSSLGRGVSLSNRPVFQSSEFDSTDFIGDSLPGWVIDLYHNGTLIDLRIVGADGHYEFLKVPILYGNNTFKLIFSGPQGQVREEIRRFNIDSSFPHRGNFNYELSVDKKSTSLFDVGDASAPNHPVNTRIVGDIEYGITNSLVGALGVISTPLEDGQHNYLTAGLRTGIAGILGGLETAYDNTNKGRATKLFAFTSIKKVSIKAEHKQFDDFHSEEVSDFNLQLETESELDLNSILPLPFLGDLNFGINVNVEKFESGDRRTRIKNRLSKAILGVSFTNVLEKTTNQSSESTLGVFSLRGHYLSALIRGSLNYNIEPESKLNAFSISVQRKIYQNTLAQVSLSGSLGGNSSRVLVGSLNWDRKNYRLALSANVDDDKNFAASANLLFSLGNNPSTKKWYVQGRPMANNGGVLANAYLDTNLNKQFDESDELIDHAGFLIDKKRHTTDNGLSFSTDVLKNRYATVTIDPVTLGDPLWEPAVEGYKVFPRPGVVTLVSFPVVTASEIDGTVYLVDNQGNERILSRVEVQLVNVDSGEIVKRFKSEYDGYYLFEKVTPGEYYIRIRNKDLNQFKAVQTDELKMNISSESDVYSDYDIRLTNN